MYVNEVDKWKEVCMYPLASIVLVTSSIAVKGVDFLSRRIPFLSSHEYLLSVFLFLALATIAWFFSKKFPGLCSQSPHVIMLSHFLLYGILFGLNYDYTNFYTIQKNGRLFLNPCFILGLSIMVASLIPKMRNTSLLNRYNTRGMKILIFLISLYAAFAAFGRFFFFERPITMISFFRYGIAVLWILPMLYAALYGYEKALKKIETYVPKKQRSPKFVWLAIFAVFVGIWGVYFIACNPASMSVDSIGMWEEAIGNGKVGYLAFPSIVVIFVRILTRIIPSPAFVVWVQILVFAAVSTSFLLEFFKRGFPFMLLVIFTAIFAVLPSNGLMVITLWSNISYTLSLLFLTLMLVRVRSSVKKGEKLSLFHILETGIALALTFTTRSTGFIPAILSGVYLIGLAFSQKKGRLRVLASALLGCLLVVLIQGPLYQTMTIRGEMEEEELVYVVWLQALDGLNTVLYYDGDLPEGAEEYMLTQANREEWKDAFHEYDIPYRRFYEFIPYETVTKAKEKEVVFYYMRAFMKEPALMIRNRLNNANLLWDITQASGAHNERVWMGVVENDMGIEHRDNALSTLFRQIALSIIPAISLLDILLYRSGIYIILSMLLAAAVCARKRSDCLSEQDQGKGKTSLLSAFLPMLGDVIALFLSLNFPAFRHVWFIPVLFSFLSIYFLLELKKDGTRQAAALIGDTL